MIRPDLTAQGFCSFRSFYTASINQDTILLFPASFLALRRQYARGFMKTIQRCLRPFILTLHDLAPAKPDNFGSPVYFTRFEG
jgi:hypothetical protein